MVSVGEKDKLSSDTSYGLVGVTVILSVRLVPLRDMLCEAEGVPTAALKPEREEGLTIIEGLIPPDE
jgi:hypothetical protein